MYRNKSAKKSNKRSEREILADLIRNNEYEADLAVINGKLVNVHSSEIYDAGVAISNKRISLIAENVKDFVGKRTRIFDASGKFLAPGLIDAHYHVAGTYLTMTNLADALLARGTTAIASDFYEYGAVGGVRAIKYALNEAAGTDLKVLFNVPLLAYVQNDPFSNSGKIRASDLMEMLDWDSAIALCEVQPETLQDPAVRKLIETTRKLGKTVVGHYVGFDEAGLASWMALGPTSDHESTTSEEAFEKVRRGVKIAIREGSAATDLSNVIRAITEKKLDSRRFMFCTDEIDALELNTLGHMDYKIRKAVSLGISPIEAIQMGTINAAEYFGVDGEIGSIVPGKIADIIIAKDLQDFRVDNMFVNGKFLSDEVYEIKPKKYPDFMKKSIKLAKRSVEHFRIKAMNKRVRANVIIAREGFLISDRKIAEVRVKEQGIVSNPDEDILKISVVDRYGSNRIGNALISGFGLRSGAMAESFNPIPENIIAIGVDDEDIALAVNRISDIQGGFVVVDRGRILAELRLPILGLISEKPLEQVSSELEIVMEAAKKLGCQLKSPFLTLMFMGYPLIPTLKITEKGLVDVEQMKYIDVVVKE
jgi:adenine deaminase